MKRDKKIGKCPECCPDGGACFTKELTSDWMPGDEGYPVWRCQNCRHEIKCRVLKSRLDKPLKAQQQIIDWLSESFGGTVEIEMIGRKAYVTLRNPTRGFWHVEMCYGTVHPNGRFNITFPQIGGDVKIDSRSGVFVYFRRTNPALKEENDILDQQNRRMLDILDGVAK